MLTLAQKSVNAQLIMIMPGGGRSKGTGSSNSDFGLEGGK